MLLSPTPSPVWPLRGHPAKRRLARKRRHSGISVVPLPHRQRVITLLLIADGFPFGNVASPCGSLTFLSSIRERVGHEHHRRFFLLVTGAHGCSDTKPCLVDRLPERDGLRTHGDTQVLRSRHGYKRRLFVSSSTRTCAEQERYRAMVPWTTWSRGSNTPSWGCTRIVDRGAIPAPTVPEVPVAAGTRTPPCFAADHGHNRDEQTRHNSLRFQGNARSVTRSFSPIRRIAAHACTAQVTLSLMELIPVG